MGQTKSTKVKPKYYIIFALSCIEHFLRLLSFLSFFKNLFWLDITIFFDFFFFFSLDNTYVFSLFFFMEFFPQNQSVYMFIHKLDHLGFFYSARVKVRD